jgi:plastocyanin
MSVRTALVLIISISLVASIAGCSGKSVTAETPTTMANSTRPDIIDSIPETSVDTIIPTTIQETSVADNRPTILIGLDGGFNPLTLTIEVGDTVNLENDDCCNPHTVNSNFPFADTIDPGLTGNVTFNRAGKYTLWIDNDLSVIGTVNVG